MRSVDLLHELQLADTALAAERRRLAELRTLLADRAELDAAVSARDEARGVLERLQSEQLDQELAAESQRAKIKELDAKLYGGTVASSKELGNLSNEATMLRKQLSTREDRILELYERVEAAQAALASAEAHAREAEQAHQDRHEHVMQEGREVEGRLQQRSAQRSELRAKLEPKDLAEYDRLASTRGTAVAESRQRTCQACRITLPVGLENKARGHELVHCPNCGRVLYLRV